MPFKRFWHESYDSGVPSMVHFEETTLSRALARNADRFPDHPALMFLGNTIRYRRLDEMVDRLSHALAALGTLRKLFHFLPPSIKYNYIKNYF